MIKSNLLNPKSILKIIITALLVYGAIYLFDHYNEFIIGFIEGFNKKD
ncbi:hypothetical protein [Faecalibacter rhinopitheci]|uniref:Uncharacterized protein n=1 Tax=Faecalibacter rhinopitheci TaxID=2779678 RepID=A0A8J7K4L3_9FLAO|nr:hypothetical protein [Faecalibacter rhinopitheci]MBF0597739.1 hypothetical protein [Faecalibacter rhinopitheci]